MNQPAVVEPTSAPRVDNSVLTLVVAGLGIFVAYLPIAGVSVILGAIGTDTKADTPDLQWVTASYVLAMAAAVLSAGVIGDLFGRRRVLIAGFVLVALGAAVGFIAGLLDGVSSIFVLWGSQGLMGIGGGALLTSTLALVTHVARDQHQRARYVGLWASFLLVGAGVGPFISGGLLSFTTWGWVFVPLGALALVMIPLALTTVKETVPVPGRHIDIPGQITAIIAVLAIVFGIIQGGAEGWGSLANVIGIAVGVVMLVAFVRVEKRTASPLVRMDVFRSAGFTVSAIAAMVSLFSVVGSSFVLSLFFSAVQHLTVLEIAERTAFLLGTAAIFGPIAAQLQRRVNAGVPLIVGLIVGGAGMLNLIGVHADSSLLDVGWRLALAGAGIGMVLSTVSTVAIHSVPLALAGMAGATNTLFRQVGAALGPAVIGAIITAQLRNGGTLENAIHVAGIVIASALVATAIVCAIALLAPAKKHENAQDARDIEVNSLATN